MEKLKLVLLAIVMVGSVVLSLNGCVKPEIVCEESLGVILDMNVIPTSFNQAIKTSIKTEKAVVVILGIVSVPLGKEAWIVEFSDDMRRIRWEGSQRSYLIY